MVLKLGGIGVKIDILSDERKISIDAEQAGTIEEVKLKLKDRDGISPTKTKLYFSDNIENELLD